MQSRFSRAAPIVFSFGAQCRPDGELPGGQKGFAPRCGNRIPLLHTEEMASDAAQLQKGVFSVKNILNSIRLSARNFNSIYAVAVCGMLLALKIVLGLFTVDVSTLLKIGFSYLPVAAAGMLLGPLAGGAVGALGDVLSYVVRPDGPYFPGFTVSAFLGGFLYGLMFYGKPVKPARTFAAKALVTAVVSFLLNPLWLSILWGKAFWAIISTRLAVNLAAFPVEAVLLLAVLKVLERCRLPQLIRKKC